MVNYQKKVNELLEEAEDIIKKRHMANLKEWNDILEPMGKWIHDNLIHFKPEVQKRYLIQLEIADKELKKKGKYAVNVAIGIYRKVQTNMMIFLRQKH